MLWLIIIINGISKRWGAVWGQIYVERWFVTRIHIPPLVLYSDVIHKKSYHYHKYQRFSKVDTPLGCQTVLFAEKYFYYKNFIDSKLQFPPSQGEKTEIKHRSVIQHTAFQVGLLEEITLLSSYTSPYFAEAQVSGVALAFHEIVIFWPAWQR